MDRTSDYRPRYPPGRDSEKPYNDFSRAPPRAERPPVHSAPPPSASGAFFAGSHNFTVSGSSFHTVGGDAYHTTTNDYSQNSDFNNSIQHDNSGSSYITNNFDGDFSMFLTSYVEIKLISS
jgi:hypothetical protein